MRRSFAARRNRDRALDSMSREALDMIARSKGIRVTSRWSDKRVIERIREAG